MKKNLFTSNFKSWPRAFLVCLGLLVSLRAVELFVLPLDYFSFRVWEALYVDFAFPGPFYPNIHLSREETGDLGHHTPYAVPKKVDWHTDAYGYRKKSSTAPPQIVIIGDSLIGGTSLTQDDILSEVLEKKLGVGVYPFAPADINKFRRDRRFEEAPPQVVVLGIMERGLWKSETLPALEEDLSLSWAQERAWSLFQKFPTLGILLDRLMKDSLLRAAKAQLARWAYRLYGHSPVNEAGGLLFFEGEKALEEIPEEKIRTAVETLLSYQRFFEKKNIRFILLPIPNKENIHHGLFPKASQPTALGDFMGRLKNKGLQVVNVERAYRERTNPPGEGQGLLLYHIDDTHWNSGGVRVAAEALHKEIEVTSFSKPIFSQEPKEPAPFQTSK